MNPRCVPGAHTTSALSRFVAKPDEGTRGAVAVEFALLVPILALLFVFVIDLGLGFYRTMQVQNAAEMGAQYAALHGFDSAAIANAVANATSFSGISASPAPSQFCGCASNTGVASVACSSSCSGGGAPGTYVSVSAQATYTPLLPYPGLPNSFTLIAQPTVRIQ